MAQSRAPVTQLLTKGKYRARASRAPIDVGTAQALRTLAFGCEDSDALDEQCTHILVEDLNDGRLKCCYRMLKLTGKDVSKSYSAQFYDLSRLAHFEGPMVEMGRFCTHPECGVDADLMRVAWGAMTAFVDDHAVELLFGCSSFVGPDPNLYLDCFAVLNARHIAPDQWSPRVKAVDVIQFSELDGGMCDVRTVPSTMPPLLRTYLLMGGWVSDHAVIDQKMNTIHVFTGVEVRKIPHARQRLLRAVVG
jgi:putative hemolysin